MSDLLCVSAHFVGSVLYTRIVLEIITGLGNAWGWLRRFPEGYDNYNNA